MLLAKRNWEMAEPGILYWDHIKDNNLLYGNDDFCYAGVNPCAGSSAHVKNRTKTVKPCKTHRP
jgi:hypothetical protein